jgi:DNA-binding transcriptional LysR family regulator
MNPNHLRTFIAVEKHLNFTRAAKELLLSQPAVSRQISQLEESLEVALFEQIGKTVFITDAGRTLAREARHILGSIERTKEAVRAYRTSVLGSLRIGASTTPGLYLLPKPLRLFRQRFPSIDLRFTVQNSEAIGQMLVENELDIGFVGGPLSNPSLAIEPLAKDEVVCFASPTNPLTKKSRITQKSLSNETWIMRERGSATRELLETWLDSNGGNLLKTIEIHSSEEAKLLVDAGVGISCMSILGLGQDLREGRFNRLNVRGLSLKRTIHLVRHVDKHTSNPMQAFLKMVWKI